MKQRIFISVARGFDLSKKERSFKWSIAKYLEFQGFIAELFSFEEPTSESILVLKSCSLINLKILVIRCSGAIILGLERSYGIF